MLVLSRKTNQRIMIGDQISLMIVEIRGDNVKIAIDAPKDVKIYRSEIYDAIAEENRQAAMQDGVDATTLMERLKPEAK